MPRVVAMVLKWEELVVVTGEVEVSVVPIPMMRRVGMVLSVDQGVNPRVRSPQVDQDPAEGKVVNLIVPWMMRVRVVSWHKDVVVSIDYLGVSFMGGVLM